jgi:hypothetical protein
MSDGPVQRFFWRAVDALGYVVRTTAAIAFFFFITVEPVRLTIACSIESIQRRVRSCNKCRLRVRPTNSLPRTWVVISPVAIGIAAMRALLGSGWRLCAETGLPDLPAYDAAGLKAYVHTIADGRHDHPKPRTLQQYFAEEVGGSCPAAPLASDPWMM